MGVFFAYEHYAISLEPMLEGGRKNCIRTRFFSHGLKPKKRLKQDFVERLPEPLFLESVFHFVAEPH